MTRTQEVYVSTDVESDGPIPGEFSMLSLASAAFTAEGKYVGAYAVNLERTGQNPDGEPSTMEWWSKQPVAWTAHRQDLVHPERAMREYATWLEQLPGKPVFVGYPAGFDFTFVYWYLIRYVGRSPFGFQALDMKTYAMSLLGVPFKSVSKKTMPKHWFSQRSHTHIALDDAIEQGELFCSMLKHRRQKDEK